MGVLQGGVPVPRGRYGVADAVCKTCKRAAGGAMDEAETSSPGSSSSTDLDVEPPSDEGNEPLG